MIDWVSSKPGGGAQPSTKVMSFLGGFGGMLPEEILKISLFENAPFPGF